MAQREPQSSGWPSNLVRWPRPLALPRRDRPGQTRCAAVPANVVAFGARRRGAPAPLEWDGPPAA